MLPLPDMANLLAIVSYKIFPADMGGQKGIVKFYEYLSVHHRVSMAVSFDNHLPQTNYPVERMVYPHRKMALNILRLFRLRKKIRKEKIDCIVAEHSYTGWIALLLRMLTGVPFIIHSHNIETSRFRLMGRNGWQLYRHYEGWIHRQADFNFFKTNEEKQVAIREFRLRSSRCAVVSFGIDTFIGKTDVGERMNALGIPFNGYLLYFNGTLDYKPNAEALERLLDAVCPLLNEKNFNYTLLVSGKSLPHALHQKIAQTNRVQFLGFVPDASLLYQGCDVFLNPVQNNSGVKTKLIEALSHHCTTVSVESGATGVRKELCGENLLTVADNDWPKFAELIIENANRKNTQTPREFFEHYSWENIAAETAGLIKGIIPT